MLELLASPWVFGSVLSISFLIAFITYRVGSFRLSKGEFSVGKDIKKKVSPHSMCPHARDIMEIIHRTIEYSEKRQELPVKLLDDQMRFFEETEEEIIGELKKIFLSVLSDKLTDVDSFATHHEYIAYIVTLKAISADIKSYVRNCFKANHYAQQEPNDQRNYIEKKKSVIIQKISEALNLYWRGATVTRSELYKANLEKIRVFESFTEHIFNRAFHLAREVQDELDKLEKKYKDYLTMTVGSDF